MEKKHLLVIEHCEKKLSKWLFLEYKNSIKIWGKNTIFTNVSDKKTFDVLRNISKTEKKNAKKFLKNKRSIVLDPKAKKMLTTNVFPEDYQCCQLGAPLHQILIFL